MCLLQKDYDFSSFESNLVEYEEGYKDLQEMVQNELVKTKILVESSKWSMKLNWRGDHNTYCLHPYNTKAEWKIYVIANKRNQILSQLHKEKVIETKNKIENCDFFWGWNINFQYDDHFFQWYGSSNEKELDVYLMEDDWKDYKKRPNPSTNKGTDDDEYYCFRVDGDDVDIFKEQLDKLIEKAKSDRS